MIYIHNDSTDPFFNHALELFVMRQMEDEAFILWRNRPSILIGRNQNTLSEIHGDFVRAHQIDVVRRLSGGGTVFCDLGNINFTFITKKQGEGGGFERFALPVVNALKALGLPAAFSGRNDIVLDGLKISGNAQYHEGNKLLHHGTILYSGNLKALAGALRPKALKFVDKSVKSVAARVTNISEHMTEPMDVLAFRDYLKDHIMAAHQIKEVYHLSESDLEAVRQIQREKFESYEWNYGKSPSYTFNNEVRFPAGTFEFQARVKGGILAELAIHGDFFGERSAAELAEALRGCRFEREALSERIGQLEVESYIQNLSSEELLKGLLDLQPRSQAKPDWLKVRLQGGRESQKVNRLLSELSLHTVCQEANCPNRMECYNSGTATFMILGRNCTRNCTFCNVTRERPDPVDSDEPRKVAEAVKRLGLKHAVITSVTRDDLPDQGAGHFAAVVRAIRALTPEVSVEVLIPDFSGQEALIDLVLTAKPDVLNHNVETVPELYEAVRPMARFERSLAVLAYAKAKAPELRVKSGMMLGLGEREDQVVAALRAIRGTGCDLLTLGQYLQPSPEHIAMAAYVHPSVFERLKAVALEMGFKAVASAPLVRSSYHAEELNEQSR